MATIKWVAGDTAPVIPITLYANDGVTPYTGLAGATVRFRIKDPDTGVEMNTNSNNTCTIVSTTLATLTYSFNATDTTPAKNYTADIEVTLSSGKISTPFEQIILQVRDKN